MGPLRRLLYGSGVSLESDDDTVQNAAVFAVLCCAMQQDEHRKANMPGFNPGVTSNPPLIQRAQTSSSQVPNDEGSQRFYEKSKKRSGRRDAPKRKKAEAFSVDPNDEGSQRFYEKSKKRPGRRDAPKRKKAEAFSIDDGWSDVVSYPKEENALKMARYNEIDPLVRRLAETEKQLAEIKMQEHDLKVLGVKLETLPERERGPILAMQNEILVRHGFPPRG